MKYTFIGWCKEDNHDKVWGVIDLRKEASGYGTHTYVTFWGRRGKKLQTKVSKEDEWTMKRVIDSKRKRYTAVTYGGLNDVYPEFESDLEKTAVWSILKL